MTLTPIQQAMCATLHKYGWQGICNSSGDLSVSAWRKHGTGWVIDIDGHTITQEEYEQWVSKQTALK